MSKRITIPEGKVAPILTAGQLDLLIGCIRNERRIAMRANAAPEEISTYAILELTLLDTQD